MTNCHSELIDRLSKLDAPDREVDREIWEYLFGDKPVDFSMPLMEYTASVDAAIALAARVFPGWHWSIYDTDGVGRCNAQLERPDFTGAEDFDGTGATPAIALLITLLRAKEASNA
ncbi:MAG: hypothetical protein IH622_13575 [Ochrobactrum anthropi]|uniref:Uncharacterized protein n=1 Tax=Brucella anthropi TaxID=529 RepID=A0A8I0N587_BRUAN|nr:hypothetical protein [Brucella anthropi]MBE0561827.1 hypothetical protein [Brucella anthropi]